MKSTPVALLLFLALGKLSLAQPFSSLIKGQGEKQTVPRDGPEGGRASFNSMLTERNDRERGFYQLQYELMQQNKTLSSLLVKLKDPEEVEEEGSFFDPFFQWIREKKKSKFEKFSRLKEKGLGRMSEKMAKWNMTGLSQRFYGVETGVSVLEMQDSSDDAFGMWLTVLADPDVEFAEMDMKMDLFGSCDLLSDWGYRHSRADLAQELLGMSKEGSDTESKVLVAVIDSGVDYEHPLLRDRIWVNEAENNGIEGVDDDGNGLVDDIWGWNFASNTNDVRDIDGHGTHVAGIIAAEASFDPEFSGVAPNVMILPCRFTDDSESGSVSAAIQCIEYAFEMGVDILSNSWGGAGAYSLALEEAMDRASFQGKLQINAAGNSAVNNDGAPEQATFPAAFDTDIIISVAAIDSEGSLSDTSNFGKQSTDIGAPGVAIYSTQLDGQFLRMTGTSQATPFVTAAAALLIGACRQQQIECAALDVKHALIDGATRQAELEGRLLSAGFLDIPRAAEILGLVNSSSVARNDVLTVCSSASSLRVSFYLMAFISCILCFSVQSIW